MPRPAPTTSLTTTLLGSILALPFITGTASANEVTYRCGPLPPVTIVDGAPGDDDVLPDRIAVEIDCTVDDGFGNIWRATGTLVAHADQPDAASMSFKALTIRNVSGNINAQMLTFEHVFPPIFPDCDQSASVNGHFDNLIAPGWLFGGHLTYNFNVDYGTALQYQLLLAGATPWETGPAAIPIQDDGLVYTIPTPHRQRGDLFFYLDSPGDAIIMVGADEGIAVETVALCPGDIDGDIAVGIADLLAVLAAWGPCVGCPEDIDGSGVVDVGDMLAVLAAWGACP